MNSEIKPLDRRMIETEDGSHSLFVPSLNETYHSIHGAIQETEHIFIKDALAFKASSSKKLNVLEIGFGTGLNALLSLQYGFENDLSINYTGIEKYPVSIDEAAVLNYPELIDDKLNLDFQGLHSSPWEEVVSINPNFHLIKLQRDIRKMDLDDIRFDVVYFDAFGPDVQTELWTVEVFQSIYRAMKRGGVLTTYSVKGIVRRAMKTVGFSVEKIPGPPGKREITRAIKI